MSSPVTPSIQQQNKAVIFISYAREDETFARRLEHELQQYGLQVTGDWLLTSAPDFRQQLRELILAADVFLFVISPDSVDSAPCSGEIDIASENNKRILPILFREGYKDEALHQAVRYPQWVYLRTRDDFDGGVAKLRDGISTDFALMKLHTRLLSMSDNWERANRNAAFLLRGQGLREAEEWMPQASANTESLPNPTRSQIDFILASRRARTRSLKLRTGIAMVTAAVLISLSIFSIVQGQIAKQNAEEAVAATREREKALERVATEQHEKELALNRAEEESAKKRKAEGERDEEIKQKEKALTDKIAALAAERKASEQARREAIRAVHSNLNFELATDDKQKHIPFDLKRQQHLSELLKVAKDTDHKEAVAQLSDKLSCLPKPSARQEVLPSDPTRLNVALDRSGARLLVAYKDRLEILDARTHEKLTSPKHFGPRHVGNVWLEPDQYQDRVLLAFEYEGEVSSNKKEIEILQTSFDDSPIVPIHPQTKASKNALLGPFSDQWKVNRTLKAYAASTAPAGEIKDPSELTGRLKTKLKLNNLSEVVIAAYNPVTHSGIYIIYTLKQIPGNDPFTPATFRTVLYDGGETVIELPVPPQDRNVFVMTQRMEPGNPNSFRIMVSKWSGDRGDVSALDTRHQIAVVGNRLYRWAGTNQPQAEELPYNPSGVKELRFSADGNRLLISFINGPVGSYNLANKRLHRFSSAEDTRQAVSPKDVLMVVLGKSGEMETWDLSVFGSNGWVAPRCSAGGVTGADEVSGNDTSEEADSDVMSEPEQADEEQTGGTHETDEQPTNENESTPEALNQNPTPLSKDQLAALLRDQLESRVKQMIVDVLAVDEEAVQRGSLLEDDLEMDADDHADLIDRLQKEFSIKFSYNAANRISRVYHAYNYIYQRMKRYRKGQAEEAERAESTKILCREQIEAKVRQIIVDESYVVEKEIMSDSRLVDDLDMNPQDMVYFAERLEKEFDIKIVKDDMKGFNQVRDVYDYIEQSMVHRNKGK